MLLTIAACRYFVKLRELRDMLPRLTTVWNLLADCWLWTADIGARRYAPNLSDRV